MSTTFGSARLATRDELKAEGMLGDTRPGAIPAGLMTGWWYENKYDFEPVHYGHDLHQLIVGGTGSGKFTTALAPMLLGSGLEDQTVIAVDPKGQLANLSGTFFQTPFAARDVFLLDPWDLCGTGSGLALNVIDTIRPETNPEYIDDVQALADAMISPSGGENMHWDETARGFLVALLLYLAVAPEEAGQRDLVRLRKLVVLPLENPKKYTGPKRQTMKGLLYAYCESKLAGGAIAEGFQGLLNRGEKEQSGILSILEKETRWIKSDAIHASLRGKSVDLEAAALKGGKYFIVIPPRFFHSHRAWVRLMLTAFYNALMRWSPPRPDLPAHKRWRHIVIDEFANLGVIPWMLNAAAVSRDYRIKFHFVTQDFPLLKKAYGDAWESLVNNCFVRAFGVGDYFTAEYLSKLIGSTTVQTRSYGTTESETSGWSEGMSYGEGASFNPGPALQPGSTTRSSNSGYTTGQSGGTSRGRSENRAEAQRLLMTADEIRRLRKDAQLLIFRGMHVVQCWRPTYWEIFLSLPDYKLNDVFGTLNRAPRDEAERKRFLAWRDKPFLRAPEPVPVKIAATPPPRPIPPALAPPGPTPWRLKTALIAGAALMFVYVIWPSTKPATVTFTLPSAPLLPPSVVLAPPPVAPVIKPVRAAVPGPGAIRDARGGPEVRDALLNAARAQLSLCSPGHADDERKLIGFLIESASRKAGYAPSDITPEQRAARQKRLTQFLNSYLDRPAWTRPEREEVFELLVRLVKEDFSLQSNATRALDRLYSNGNCPFDTVAASDYLPPNYVEPFSIADAAANR